MQPWFTVHLFDIGHPCYDQLTPVKTRYSLTSITWPYRWLKFTTHRVQVFFFKVDRWPSAGFSIGSRANVWLTCWKQGRIVQKQVNANPGLNVNQIITFSFQMFCCFILCIWCLLKLKTEGQTIYRLLNSNQNSTFSWVSLIGLWTTRPRSYVFRLA